MTPAHSSPNRTHLDSTNRLWRPLGVFAVLITTMLICGCGPRGAEKRVIGTWVISPGDTLGDKMFGNDEALNETETSGKTKSSERETDQQARSQTDDEATDSSSTDPETSKRVGIAVHFLKGGKLVTETRVMDEVTTKEGTWKVIANEGDRVEIEFVLQADEPQQITMLFENDHTARMVPPNLAVLKREYVFNKK